ncbi:hypothetical protein C1H46_041026 [Malus baccata]|uniref:Uncharacterized protein n=1 Tax=Malus baccata TaxID=106549 RepID=A0A540KGZ8_MALBA|nr:hypothetical protein C1H46_041026 [Malus baccata]
MAQEFFEHAVSTSTAIAALSFKWVNSDLSILSRGPRLLYLNTTLCDDSSSAVARIQTAKIACSWTEEWWWESSVVERVKDVNDGGVDGGPAADKGADGKGRVEDEGKGGFDEVKDGLEWVYGGGGAMHLGNGGPD